LLLNWEGPKLGEAILTKVLLGRFPTFCVILPYWIRDPYSWKEALLKKGRKLFEGNPLVKREVNFQNRGLAVEEFGEG